MEHEKSDFDVNDYGEEDKEKQGEEGKNRDEGTMEHEKSDFDVNDYGEEDKEKQGEEGKNRDEGT
ncbi:hypothetical protein S83_056595, partial [Arachis hypogaea]